MRYKVVGCSRRGNKGYGAVATVISTAGAIGNDGVGNVEGGEIGEAAGSVCRISRECGISDSRGINACEVETAAKISCSIAIESGIGEFEGALVEDATTMDGCSITREGGISNGGGT